ncbi:LysR family transcriptional regulator [Calycomorphotria hydatis]|uniref:Hydrogen peroxide-inducible genes activator n=1 Tax=Calycomorphotria hydatis TaxID=2528027 RepID=A0A517TBN8_9PLAN|nr:LysR family transcriptional regulator [Calycomorphotria hydatis]QDT65780.1 Hydrogen peroxide-inducible genes activator [Calycomorphotria hydatis]
MEFDQLRYFLRVAEQANITHAANEIGISQSALSRSIQRLEEELGRPVFERKAKSLALTDAGQLLQSRAHHILSILEDTKAEITDDGHKGRIRIGAIPTIAPYFLPDLLRKFATEYPEASVIIQEETTERLLKSVSSGTIDLAILALPISAKYLELEELFEEELLLVLSPTHPLADKPKISLRDIESLPFVLLDEAHCLSDNIITFCRQKSLQPVAVEHTSQLTMVQELVSLDHGISMIPAMARNCDQSDRRVYRSLNGKSPTRKIAALWNPYRFQSRLLSAFRQMLREYSSNRTERA